MVFTTAMGTWNGFHYCYGEKEWFSLLLWRQGMVIYCVFRLILDTYGITMGNKNHILCFSDYFRHLWSYNEHKNHIYCVFRIILDTYGIIMRNKNHIYCVFRFILHTYGIIMKIKIIFYYILCFILYNKQIKL